MSRLPLIGVTACSRQIGLHASHTCGDPCVHAVAAMILPALADVPAPSDILDGPAHILFSRSSAHNACVHHESPLHRAGIAGAAGPDGGQDAEYGGEVRAPGGWVAAFPLEGAPTGGGKAFALGVHQYPQWQVSSSSRYPGFPASGDACGKRVPRCDADASHNLAYKSQETHA